MATNSIVLNDPAPSPGAEGFEKPTMSPHAAAVHLRQLLRNLDLWMDVNFPQGGSGSANAARKATDAAMVRLTEAIDTRRVSEGRYALHHLQQCLAAERLQALSQVGPSQVAHVRTQVKQAYRLCVNLPTAKNIAATNAESTLKAITLVLKKIEKLSPEDGFTVTVTKEKATPEKEATDGQVKEQAEA